MIATKERKDCKRRQKGRSVLCVLYVLSWLFLPGLLCAAEAKPKLALCASGDKKAGDIVELMAVELSKDNKVDLLDRASINKVLAEQKMALSGMLSTEDALKAGQLLQCDIFAELHREKATAENPEVTSLVAFDAVTGVRLCDTAVQTEDDLEQAAKSVIKLLRTSLGKWQGSGTESKCRTVSLVSVRNVNLPETLNHVPKIIGPLLERQLLQSPEIAVLERKRLESVNKEAAISGDRRDRLLTSSVLLDLDISKGNEARFIRIRAALSSVDDGTTGFRVVLTELESKEEKK